MNTISNGKGSSPRKIAKKKFDSAYDSIKWKKDSNNKTFKIVATDNGICKRYTYK